MSPEEMFRLLGVPKPDGTVTAYETYTVVSKRHTFCKNGHALLPGNVIVHPDGRHRCRTCAKEYHRQWRQKNRERWAAYQRKYRAARKARKENPA